MENHHFSWENPLFLLPFSIAMLNYQRVFSIDGLHWEDVLPGQRYLCGFLNEPDGAWKFAQSEKMLCKKNRKVHDPSSVFLIFNLFVSFPKPKKRSDPDGPGMVIHPKFPNLMGSQRAYDLSFVSPGFLFRIRLASFCEAFLARRSVAHARTF